MTAVVDDPRVPPPLSGPVTLKHVTAPERFKPTTVKDTVPLGFWPEVPLCALMLMFENPLLVLPLAVAVSNCAAPEALGASTNPINASPSTTCSRRSDA
jgi:hypothetical protein